MADEKVENILKLCIKANFTGSLWQLGLRWYSDGEKSRIMALPSYQEYVDAGWTPVD